MVWSNLQPTMPTVERGISVENYKEQPSSWLLKNSSGKPDFLFTLLTYSFILLVCISIFWIALGIPALKHAADAGYSKNILAIMDNVKTGLISLAGLVFGLASSYTVRRFQQEKLSYEKVDEENMPVLGQDEVTSTTDDLVIVDDEEDI